MSLRPLIAALPADFVLTFVDVGSAGSLHERWQPFQSILSAVLFEPREGGTATGSLGRGQSRTHPVALGDRAGEVDLHITALANMSSFLEPDASLFGRYRKKGADARVVSTERVPVERLDALAAADGFTPDVLKVDTQGSELLVLKGAEESLRFRDRRRNRSVLPPSLRRPAVVRRHRGLDERPRLRAHRARPAEALSGGEQPQAPPAARRGTPALGPPRVRRCDLHGEARNRSSHWRTRTAGRAYSKGMIALLAYGKTDQAAALLDAGRETLPAGRRRRSSRRACRHEAEGHHARR